MGWPLWPWSTVGGEIPRHFSVIYYDHGQQDLNKLLIEAFSAQLTNAIWKTVQPADYKLFQVADLLCTLELVRAKLDTNSLSLSERNFFTTKELKKTYLSGIAHLQFEKQ